MKECVEIRSKREPHSWCQQRSLQSRRYACVRGESPQLALQRILDEDLKFFAKHMVGQLATVQIAFMSLCYNDMLGVKHR
eukprot:135478-Amphidinium_carterae.1